MAQASNPNRPISPQFYLAIALITVLSLVVLFFTRVTATPSLSPVAGLMQLKALTQVSVPYETAISNGKPTFLEFYADWCSSCQAMASSVGNLHEQYGGRVNFVMLDIDSPAQAQRVAQYGVTGVPHFIALDSKAAIADSRVGRVPARILERSLEQAIAQTSG